MNKKGFTLVELLAVIAILAILVIIALPNVLKMYNDSKKNAFMTEAQTLAKEVSSKYISESMKGNKVSVISNKQNPLDMTGRELEYSFELDSQGKIKNMIVSNGTYCISTNKDYTKITRNDISDKCSYEKLHNIVGTLKNKFYEESGRTDRSLVSSIVFYSDGRTINGAESYDVSEKKDGSIKMYVSQNTENTSLLDLTIVANGKIDLPEDSSNLFAFYVFIPCSGPRTNLKEILFNDSVSTFNVTNMYRMFNVLATKSLDLSSFDTSNVTDMSWMFANSQATEIKGLNKFNTSKVTNMSQMFSYSKMTILDLSSFDTSNVTDMSWMFANSQATEIKGLNKFNTSKVTDMNYMFAYSKAPTLNLSNFDTSKVTNMGDMFYESKATALDLNNFDTSKVTDMSGMFAYSKAPTLDLSSFDTSNVANMGSMFQNSQATEIKGLNKFNTSKVTSMGWMFYNSKATTLDLSSFDTSNVTNMGSMFYNSDATKIKGLNKFNTSKVTDMSWMFDSSKATALDLSSFDTSNVTKMNYMFRNSDATEIKGLNKFNTSKVTDMYGMFEESVITTLDLSSFDISKVKYTNEMFKNAKATTGYARTQADADKFNNSSYKPSGLTFVVK